jgi:hypothetical protein
MKKILAPLCLFMLLSCTTKKEKDIPPQTNVPKALQVNKDNKSIGFGKRSFDNDILEELYEEKLKTTPVLKEIEAMMNKLSQTRNDSLEVYNDFNSKNLQYYNSAERYLSRVKDSLLQSEIKIVLRRSIAEYDNKMSGLNNLVSILNKKPGSVDDRFIILKILISLAMIKEYQQGNIPSSKPVQAAIHDHDELIQKMDSVIRKNK